jgi:hypothetical protein
MSSIYPDAEDLYHGPVRPLDPPSCNCYECTGSDIRYTDDGHKYVHNNLKLHTLGERCENCGRPKGKHRDLGRKGYYVCYVCD